MAITAQDVNKLRKQTGAGMMDCKKALVETDGDFEAAVDVLRKKGQKVAAKRGDNDAKEGLVLAKITNDGKTGIVLSLNCETDFVAMNSDYMAFVESLMAIAMDKRPASVEAMMSEAYNDKLTVAEKIIEQVGVLGEKLDFSNLEIISADAVVAYNHPGNQLATLVALNKDTESALDAGKQVAMQVAAMNPVALNKDSIPQSVIDKELEIGRDLAIQEGKPEAMADKIAQGRLGKFFKEATLLDQAFIKDNKSSIQKYLDGVSKGLTVTEFSRVALS